MANTARIYLNRDELGKTMDDLPASLRRALAEALTEQHINDDGRIELLLIAVVDDPDLTVGQSSETVMS